MLQAYHTAMQQNPPEPVPPDSPPQAPVQEPGTTPPTTPVGPDVPVSPTPAPMSV